MIMIAMTMMVKYNYVERFQTKTEDKVGANQSWIGKYFPKKDKNLLRLYPVELWLAFWMSVPRVCNAHKQPRPEKKSKKIEAKKHFKDKMLRNPILRMGWKVDNVLARRRAQIWKSNFQERS